uniref:HipA-like C-terminal domain-containing protein n=1 Tax=Aliivibrio fischeri TaxID=668 RepID=H2ERS9_ALIFS|nr:HipA domain-containing protein [Aliivibrio fischeri]AEY78096.1 hypothetical protein [Aliivibrio fischeri]
MSTESKCLISLNELTDKNKVQDEYTKAAIIELTGDIDVTMQLPFTKQEFVTDWPAKKGKISPTGQQHKLSLVIENKKFKNVVRDGEYILKPSSDEYPNLAENEHATMLVMKMLGFAIPAFGLIRFKKDTEDEAEKAFIIHRFDRYTDSSSIPQQQLASAMGVGEIYGQIKDDKEKYVSYETVWEFLSTTLNNVNLSVKKDFFCRIFTAYLLNNNDLHLGNFSLLALENDTVLAPIYDYITVAPYRELYSDRMALPLFKFEEGGENQSNGMEWHSKYTGYDFLQFGKTLGLNEKMTGNLMDNILKKIPAILSIYQNSYIPNEYYELIEQWIKTIGIYANYREIQTA